MKYYSQCKEDQFLNEYFRNKRLSVPKVFVEIGAGLPEEFSNSLFFIKKGWKALLVEPNCE